jgi:hypothetical protein
MNLKTTVARLATLIFVTISSAICHAAVISVQPVLSAYYDLNYVPLPPIFPGDYPPGPVIAQIDVMVEVLSLDPGEDGFGFAGFNFDFQLVVIASWKWIPWVGNLTTLLLIQTARHQVGRLRCLP